MVKGDVTKPQVEHTVKKKKGLKPLSAAMRERESEERKDQLRNRIEVKRLQSVVDKLRLDLQGLGEGSQKKETPIDPRFHLKGAARAALSRYLPPEPEFVPPPNLLEDSKGKIWHIQPKGREFINALNALAGFLHKSCKKSRDAIEYYKEMLEHDDEDHLHARTQIFQCYLDKGDTKSAQEYLTQLQEGAMQPVVSDNSEVIRAVAPELQHIFHQILVNIKKQHRALSQQKDASSLSIDDILVPSVVDSIDVALATNPYLLWLLAYRNCFASFWEITPEEISTTRNVELAETLQSSVSALIDAWKYNKDFHALWEGTMSIPAPVARSKVEKLSKQVPIASTAPVYEPSIFEEVLQEYFVEKVLSPPTIAIVKSNSGALDSSNNRIIQEYRSCLQNLETMLTA